MSDLSYLVILLCFLLAIFAVAMVINLGLNDITEELRQIRFVLEDMIRDDMEHATPECARCGAECTNPQCVTEVASR